MPMKNPGMSRSEPESRRYRQDSNVNPYPMVQMLILGSIFGLILGFAAALLPWYDVIWGMVMRFVGVWIVTFLCFAVVGLIRAMNASRKRNG